MNSSAQLRAEILDPMIPSDPTKSLILCPLDLAKSQNALSQLLCLLLGVGEFLHKSVLDYNQLAYPGLHESPLTTCSDRARLLLDSRRTKGWPGIVSPMWLFLGEMTELRKDQVHLGRILEELLG